jgi:hypothetical protein
LAAYTADPDIFTKCTATPRMAAVRWEIGATAVQRLRAQGYHVHVADGQTLLRW